MCNYCAHKDDVFYSDGLMLIIKKLVEIFSMNDLTAMVLATPDLRWLPELCNNLPDESLVQKSE